MPLSDRLFLPDRQPMYREELPSGTVAAVFYLEKDASGELQKVGRLPEQPQGIIEKALAEFRRLTGGAFTPEGRCAADRAFVEIATKLLSDAHSWEDSFCGSLTEDLAETAACESRDLRIQNPSELADRMTGGGHQPCPYSGDKNGRKAGRIVHSASRHP